MIRGGGGEEDLFSQNVAHHLHDIELQSNCAAQCSCHLLWPQVCLLAMRGAVGKAPAKQARLPHSSAPSLKAEASREIELRGASISAESNLAGSICTHESTAKLRCTCVDVRVSPGDAFVHTEMRLMHF